MNLNRPPYPEVPLNYISLLTQVFENFRSIESHDHFEMLIGRDKLIDASDFWEYMSAEALAKVPEIHPQKTYHFKDEIGNNGRLDIVFRDNSLNIVSANLYFKGLLAKRRAKKYYKDLLLPALKHLFNIPDVELETDFSYGVQIEDLNGEVAIGDLFSPNVRFELHISKHK